MSGATMYIGWSKPDNTVMLSPRSSTGHIQPVLNAAANGTLLAQTVVPMTTPSWAVFTYTFTRPVVTIRDSITASTSYIYAFSNTAPLSPDSNGSSIGFHDDYGFIKLDLTVPIGSNSSVTPGGSGNVVTSKPILQLPNGVTYDTIITVHGILLFTAWSVAPVMGIMVARYGKVSLGVWWYRLHLILMVGVCGSFTVAGIVLISLFKTPPHFSGDSHRSLGLAVGVMMIVQFVLGYVSNALFDPHRKQTSHVDIAHWWFGRITLLLAVINTFLGLNLFAELGYEVLGMFKILYGVFIGLVVILAVSLEHFIGQVHHHELLNGESRASESTIIHTA